MSSIFHSITRHEHFVHETKRHIWRKFLLVLFVFIIYFAFIALKYGMNNGLLVTALTWSFFVLCTPIADAGFLLDFPFRLITKIPMLYSEVIVWLLAILINVVAITWVPQAYTQTKLLLLFDHILRQPIPFWLIILVSGIGTFMSIQFGDELLETVHHQERTLHQKHKYNYHFWLMVFVVLLSIVLYDFLLKQLGVDLPL